MCKPAAGNGGHKMSWYLWFTVYSHMMIFEKVLAILRLHYKKTFILKLRL